MKREIEWEERGYKKGGGKEETEGDIEREGERQGQELSKVWEVRELLPTGQIDNGSAASDDQLDKHMWELCADTL